MFNIVCPAAAQTGVGLLIEDALTTNPGAITCVCVDGKATRSGCAASLEKASTAPDLLATGKPVCFGEPTLI
jgi:hypothetical protein